MNSVVLSVLMSVLYLWLYILFYSIGAHDSVVALNSNVHVLLLGWALIIAGGLSACGRK